MRKTLITITSLIALLTAIFFKDISKHIPTFFHYDRPAQTSTIDAISNGVSILIKVQSNLDDHEKALPLPQTAMQQAQQSLAKRLTQYANLDYKTTPLANNHIEIQLAEVSLQEAKVIWKRISSATKLTIHQGHPLHTSNHLAANELAIKVANRDEIVPTYKAYPTLKKDNKGAYIKDKNGNFINDRFYLVKRKVAVSGSDIEFAQASQAQPGVTEVTLTEKGAQDMQKFSSNMRQGDLIITLLNGKVISAASLNAPSLGKRFIITGAANTEEAQILAAALNAPIQNDIHLIEMKVIAE